MTMQVQMQAQERLYRDLVKLYMEPITVMPCELQHHAC
jgi:hypothetical protein